MYARFRARRRRRPAIAALGVALVLVLGACDTQPATDVTPDAATLNARGACYGNMNGLWQYELRRVGGSWNSVGPLHPFACGGSGAETAIQSHRATGLAPSTTYQYRIRAWENNTGREYYFDSQGSDRGTNYDSFRTATRSDWAIHCNQNPAALGCEGTYDSNGGSDGTDSTECENGASVCASAARMQCKGKRGDPLVNVHKRLHLHLRMWEADSRHSWCWKNGKILREHLSKDGDCWVTDYGATLLHYAHSCEYKYAECAPDLNSCLYRYEAKFSCCSPIGEFVRPRITFTRCLGTRVCSYACATDGSGAYHSRNVQNGGCE